MQWLLVACVCGAVGRPTHAFWDDGTSTPPAPSAFEHQTRTSFFIWQKVIPAYKWILVPKKTDEMEHENKMKRATYCVGGISIDFVPLTTVVLLSRRTVITAANPLDPYMHRARDLRIWALGRAGLYNTPYRYRVWKVNRVLPRSVNAEHQIGPTGRFCTRHDVAVVIALDQIYLFAYQNLNHQYPMRQYLCRKTKAIPKSALFYMTGSGFVDMPHVTGNYEIKRFHFSPNNIVNCEKYLPKWWGKFICIKSRGQILGPQNGGSLVVDNCLMGLGAFEVRYNDDRVSVFTDLRYYADLINIANNISAGEYYDYAYQQWGYKLSLSQGGKVFPLDQIRYDMWPLGK